MPRVSIVIPYFQREPGILSKAIRSILNQVDAGFIEILVVDDESPVPPEGEIGAVGPESCIVRVLRQPNAGPGAARNLALANVSANADYIAFLDSDDEWATHHLCNASAAMGDDADFYFSNYLEPDGTVDEFSRRGTLEPAHHEKLNRGSNCYRYRHDMIDQVIRANVIETSTVVYRRSTLGTLRFRNDFTDAFEDHLFWIAAAQQSRSIVFSTNIECRYGRGVSIWRSSGLGNERMFRRLLDQTRYRHELERHYVRTRPQKLAVRRHAWDTRRTFVAEILYRLRRRARIDWPLVARQFWLDPLLAILALPIALTLLGKRLRSP